MDTSDSRDIRIPNDHCNVSPSDVGGGLPLCCCGAPGALFVSASCVGVCCAVWVCVVLLKGHGGCVRESTSRSSLDLHLVTPN